MRLMSILIRHGDVVSKAVYHHQIRSCAGEEHEIVESDF
jgi:hypothetical protein